MRVRVRVLADEQHSTIGSAGRTKSQGSTVRAEPIGSAVLPWQRTTALFDSITQALHAAEKTQRAGGRQASLRRRSAWVRRVAHARGLRAATRCKSSATRAMLRHILKQGGRERPQASRQAGWLAGVRQGVCIQWPWLDTRPPVDRWRVQRQRIEMSHDVARRPRERNDGCLSLVEQRWTGVSDHTSRSV